MAYVATYEDRPLSREEVDALRGPAVIEFGTNWCSFCRGAQPLIESAFATHPQLPHIKIEDGPGRPLGRSFRVKLWPTLIFLRDGQELGRVVRPQDIAELGELLAGITGGSASS